MADRFSRAMMEQVTGRPLSVARGKQSELDEAVSGSVRRDPDIEADLEAVRNGQRDPTPSPIPDAEDEWEADGPSAETTGSGSNSGERVSSDDTTGTEKPDPPGTTTGDSNGVQTTKDSADDRLVSRLRSEVDELDDSAREMLRQYRDHGPATPQEIHTAAGGSGDRGPAYATNRALRQRGLIAHVGCGQYDYALTTLVREELIDPLRPDDTPSDETVSDLVSLVETALCEETSTADGADTTFEHSEKRAKTAAEQ
jgi:hypothetical protein